MSTVYVTFWDPVTASSIGDVELTVSPHTLISSISAALPGPYRGAELYLGSQLVPGDSTFGDSPIISGCYLSAGGPRLAAGPRSAGPVAAAPTAGVLRVTGGPDAGQVFALGPGYHDIARRAEVSVTLTDQEVSRRGHTRLMIDAAGAVTVEDLGSGNGTWIGDLQVPPQVSTLAAESMPLPPGQELRVGTTVLVWTPTPPIRRAAVRSTDGLLHFDRAFAATPLAPPARFRLPVATESARSGWALLIPLTLPLVAGVLMAVFLHQPLFLLFAVLGPIGALSSHLVDRAQRRRREAALAHERNAIASAIEEHITLETRLLAERSPGPAEALMAATGMSTRLWPRDDGDPDGLLLRTGLGRQDASITLDGPPWGGLPELVLGNVPLTLDLRAIGVLGITGPRPQASELARWLIVQLATLRSPDDLRLVVISAASNDASDDEGGGSLAWTRWLPHVSAGPGAPFPAWIGTTGPTRLRRVAELQELVAQRQRSSPGTVPGTPFDRRDDVVVILDGALALRQIPGMKDVLRDGPAVGVYSICVDTASMSEYRAQCRFGAGGDLEVTRSRSDPVIGAQPDRCSPLMADLVARSIAPLRDRLALSSRERSIPYPARFLDLLGISGAPSAQDVRDRWAEHRSKPGPVTRVPIGADAEGTVTVDLAGQGPHTMLGGATGAGKSYLLQALVTSLLMANHPDELNLVLVDFKGGSAFLPFEHCPQVVSLIRSTGASAADVFDAAAARRVLLSVRAEVHRRESLLAPFGGEIDEYWRARSADPGLGPLPRLVLVFDEFARVLDVSPEFPRELVAVAAKGRALGMHLVLATQSLQGKLSPELKNAIDLRITLRQNEPADSTEVLGSSEAASIPGRLRGRGLILCTRDEPRIPRPFQAGFLGAPPPRGGTAPAQLRTLGWHEWGTPRPGDEVTAVGETDHTDLELCVQAIRAAGAGTTAPFRPLLPRLPPVLSLDALDAACTQAVTPSTVPFGLADEPARQSQPAVGLDLAGVQRLMVAGGPQQGRTTFVRTLIDSITSRFGPDQVHLYLVERAPGGLAGFEDLAHCGGVVSASEPDRLRRLAEWLHGELDRRRARAAAGSPALPAHPAHPAHPWPVIVVIVDGWEAIENRSDPAYYETSVAGTMRDVAASGVAVGIHVVAIGGQDMLNGKISGLFDRRLILAFPQPEFRRQHLAPGSVTPPALPGRAADATGGREIQLCLPSRDDTEIIRTSRAIAISPGRLPVPIVSLPQRISLSDLGGAGPSPRWIPLGVSGITDVSGLGDVSGTGGHRGCVTGVDLFGDGPSLLLIGGPRGSGRSTAIRTVLEGLLGRGVPVLLVAAARSPLAQLPVAAGQLEVLGGTTITDADLREAAKRLGTGGYAVLVDDCHTLTVEASMTAFTETPTLLTELCQATDQQRALVMAGDVSLIISGQRRSLARPVQEMLSSGHRLLLTPARSLDAREFGFTLEGDQFFAGPPGRAYLGSGHSVTLLQVADADTPLGQR